MVPQQQPTQAVNVNLAKVSAMAGDFVVQIAVLQTALDDANQTIGALATRVQELEAEKAAAKPAAAASAEVPKAA
jgi:hypothetical protein